MTAIELLSAVGMLGGVPLLIALVVTRLGGDGPTLVDILRSPEEAWPRGVQEEEPLAWRLEALTFVRRQAPAGDTGGERRSPTVVATRDAWVDTPHRLARLTRR